MRIALVGPTHPYRGGIAHYTTLLAQALAAQHEMAFYSFTRQYPGWLFPGQTDKDNSQHPLRGTCDYRLDSLNPLTWRDTAQHIKQFNPELLLLAWWHPYWSLVWLYLMRQTKQPNLKILYIVHNVVSHEARWWDKWLTQQVLSRADYLIVHSAEEQQRLTQLLPKMTATIAPHPTYAPLSQPSQPNASPATKQSLGLPDNKAILLFFGFVRPYKGLDILLEAMTRLKNQPLHLLIVGEFWADTAATTHAFINQHGLNQQVTIVNAYVPNEAINAYFALAEVVILPYRRASGSGVVQLAFGCGKPVIASNVGGLNDIVIDGETGLLVPPNNPSALANTIQRFFSDFAHQNWQANIRQHNQKFSWQALVSQITHVVKPL